LYMWDASERREAVSQELEAEREATILMMDWTYDAAAKCSSPRLFNVMSCDQKCLASKLTKSCSPKEVESELLKLEQRGVVPRLVYVDDHCCGVWKQLLPHVYVRLDGMHAIRRLVRTTTSTQHPWHGAFCRALADLRFHQQRKTFTRSGFADCRDPLRLGMPAATCGRWLLV